MRGSVKLLHLHCQICKADSSLTRIAEEQLLFACRSDNLELLQSLVADHQQLNVNATNSSGSTPLHLAVKFLSTDVLPELLEEEVDVDLREKSREGDTPLHLACRMDKEDDEETRNWVGE